ncbi:MAG: hypothetical protein MK135_01290 [Polyangiaceae bacterium]|nr:hypothetical protein [Polyangiaceae bacterium]
MSPEQARGQKKIDHRADLWSLGVVLYQLLCGRTPYQHIEALGELIISICGKPPAKIEVFAPWLTPQVGRVVHGALTKDRNTRFQTADDMLQAILKELPEGYSLQKTDLVGVPEADRSLVRIAPDTEPSAEDQEPQGVLTETDAHAVTESSMSSSAVPAKPPLFPARWAKIAAVAGAITAAGLLGVYTVQNSSRGRTEDGAQPDVASGKGLDGPVSGSSRDALVFDKAHPFRIIANSFSGYSTFRSERFRSMFERSEMVLRYTDETDHEATLAALGNGSAEIIATTLDNLLAYSAEGKVVALLDTTVGADAIVVNNKTFPQLTSLSALQQQVETEKLAKKQPVLTYTPGTTSEFLARLLSARLDSFDIDAFHILEVEEPKEAWEKLMDPAGQIAAAVLWEPYVTKAREAGYPVVLSSGDVPGSIQDVLVASSRVLEQAPEALQTFISNYYRHIDRVTANPQQMYRQVAEDGNLSPADAKSIVTGIRFTTALAAKRIIASGELEGRLNAIASVLVIDGQLDQPPQNVEELFDARFIDVAAENTLKLIAGLRADNPRAAERLEQGGRQDVTPTAVEVSDLMKAEVIGDLGLFNVGREEIGSQISNAELEAIAPKLADFSHRTTVVTLEEGPGTSDERELLRQKLESELRRRGLLHQVAIWGPNRAPSLHVRLRRRPED